MRVSRAASRRMWVLLALTALALAASAGLLLGTTGPNQVSISSTGGYNLCLSNIANGDEYATFRSIQGTRHPYQGASYTINNSVIGVTPQVSQDIVYYIFEGDPVMKYQRVDNQATSSGNGLYECKAIP